MVTTSEPANGGPFLAEPFVLRMAGLPFGPLLALADPATVAAARLLLDAERAQVALVAQTREDWVPPLVRREHSWKKIRAARTGVGSIAPEKVGDGCLRALLESIAAGWAELADLRTRFKADYDEALTRTRALVRREFVENEELRTALVALNPCAFDLITRRLESIGPDARRWSSRDRQRIDPLTRYLQRACAKNDSTGRAGPIAIGAFDKDAPRTGADDIALHDRYFLSRWAAEAVLAWLATVTDLRAVTPPRPAPGLRLVDGQADHVRLDYGAGPEVTAVFGPRTRLPLSPLEQRVLLLCDGIRTQAEIEQEIVCDAVGRAVGADVGAALDTMAARGLVIREPEIPYGVVDPVPLLERLATETDCAPLAALLADQDKIVSSLPGSASEVRSAALRQLDTRFADVLGELPARSAGGFYEDRAIVFDECVGRFGGLTVGRALVDRIERALPLVVDTYMYLPRRRDRREHAVMAEWFTARFGSGPASVNDYLAAFADDWPVLSGHIDTIDAEQAELARGLREVALAAAAPGGGGADALRRFLDEHDVPDPVVCNIDLMLAGDPGARAFAEPTRLVVGEVHSDEEMLSHSTDAPFVAERFPDYTDDILAGYRRLVRPGETVMDATEIHRDKTFVRFPLDCPDIEACGPSPVPPAQRRTLADFLVRCTDGRLQLVERRTGGAVRLVAVPFHWLGLRHNPMRVFGFPSRGPGNLLDVVDGEHIPEIAFGDLVLSRRTWSVAAGELGVKQADGFVAAQRVRDRLGLPRHVFARCTGEAKPLYVDLDSPLLVRQLSQFAGRSTHVVFSEMLPHPDELWARQGGDRFTSELRFTVFDAPATTAPLRLPTFPRAEGGDRCWIGPCAPRR